MIKKLKLITMFLLRRLESKIFYPSPLLGKKFYTISVSNVNDNDIKVHTHKIKKVIGLRTGHTLISYKLNLFEEYYELLNSDYKRLILSKKYQDYNGKTTKIYTNGYESMKKLVGAD